MQSFYQRKVTLEEILDAREKRAALQEKMRAAYGTNIVSIGINMPGSVKYDNGIMDLLYGTVNKLREAFRTTNAVIAAEHIYHASTGPGAVLAVKGDAAKLKRIAMGLEEGHGYARLLDIDVFDETGHQLSRKVFDVDARHCLVCGKDAVDCMRKGTHSLDEVIDAARKLLAAYKAQKETELLPKTVATIGIAALESMLMEVACTPAPGLVDRFNAGAHKDMDFFTFIKSSSVLSVAMQRCALAGWQHKGRPEELLPRLRGIGQEAESEMFKATGGVNTQKGILFLMGIMTAAATAAAQKYPKPIAAQRITGEAAAICRGIVKRELAAVDAANLQRKLTAGERFYIEQGITGIRGEIESNLPSVHAKGLPCFKEGLAQGLSLNDALVHALVGLMSVSMDTTILNRHGLYVLKEVQQQAANFMEQGGMLAADGTKRVLEMDKMFIARNISPGGSADLLAVTYFLYLMEERL